MRQISDHKNLVFGTRAVIEAIKSGQDVEVVYIQRDARNALLTELRKVLKEKAVPSRQLPKAAFHSFQQQNHQGVIAAMSDIQYTKLDWLLPQLFEQGKSPFFLLLDKVTDVRNFGAICRSASCFGVDAVVIPAKGSAMINSFAIKASAGALNHLAVCRVKSLTNTVKYLKESGVRILACSEKGEKNQSEATYGDPLAIVLGAEDTGISTSIMEMADDIVRIPMTGPIESLNVSVAAGIILSSAYNSRDNG